MPYYASPAPDEQHTDGMVASETIKLHEEHRNRPFARGISWNVPESELAAMRALGGIRDGADDSRLSGL